LQIVADITNIIQLISDSLFVAYPQKKLLDYILIMWLFDGFSVK